jgi:hypothetical protein
MSAIISGKCKQCNGSFYISLGHPKWFEDRMKFAKENPIYDSFDKLRRKQLCPECGKQHYAKFASNWKKSTSTSVAAANKNNERAKEPVYGNRTAKR